MSDATRNAHLSTPEAKKPWLFGLALAWLGFGTKAKKPWLFPFWKGCTKHKPRGPEKLLFGLFPKPRPRPGPKPSQSQNITITTPSGRVSISFWSSGVCFEAIAARFWGGGHGGRGQLQDLRSIIGGRIFDTPPSVGSVSNLRGVSNLRHFEKTRQSSDFRGARTLNRRSNTVSDFTVMSIRACLVYVYLREITILEI
ncbi:hypothetical protein B0H14DRAFT_2622339 [Mycena olivaceomarginata]|nr:hypothetical protein B0H14DRAFT_2622339 [Mycena olivaceomarginata]